MKNIQLLSLLILLCLLYSSLSGRAIEIVSQVHPEGEERKTRDTLSISNLDYGTLVKVIREPNGMFFIHTIIGLKKLPVRKHQGIYKADLRIIGSVSEREGNVISQFEEPTPVELSEERMERIAHRPFSLYNMFPLIPGEYRLLMKMTDDASGDSIQVERDIIVPETESFPWLGSPILGYRVESAPPENPKPFKLDQSQIFCHPGNLFHFGDDLIVMFQVLGLDPERKNSARVEYRIFSEERLVLMRGKKLDEYKSLLSIREDFSLLKILPGHYRMEIQIKHSTGEIQSTTELFIVTDAEDMQKPWVYSRTLLPASHPAYPFALGGQHFNKGEMDKARVYFEKAYESQPDSQEISLRLAQTCLLLKDYERAKSALIPIRDRSDVGYDVYYFLGKAHLGLQEFREAILVFGKALARFGANIDLLNSMGECHYRVGEPEEAIVLWEQSLRIEPNQQDIRDWIRKARSESWY